MTHSEKEEARGRKRGREQEQGQDHRPWEAELRAISEKKEVHPQKMTSGESVITFPLFMVSIMRYYQLEKGIRQVK